MRMVDLEKLYSPSKWSRRFSDGDEVLDYHMKFAIEVSERTKATIPCSLDIEYGELPNQKLDIFGIDLPADAPIFIYIHGGYWQELSYNISSYVVEPFYRKKYKVIVIGYDLCPNVTLPDIIVEVQQAFSFCMNYGKSNKTSGLYLAGHSAGAHLVASLFMNFFEKFPIQDQELLKEVYFISGVYDLIPLVDTTINIPLKLTEASAKEISPFYQRFNTKNKEIEFNVIVGEFDSPAFRQQSERFCTKLQELSLKANMILINNKDHFDIVEDLNIDDYEIVKLIVKE